MHADSPALRLRRFLRAATAGLAALALTAGASAYDIIRADGRIVKWSGSAVTFQVKLGTSPVLQDGTNYSSTVVTAMQEWNAVLGSLQLVGNIDAAGPGGDRNNINEIFFASDVYGEAFGENTIAVTVSYRTTSVQNDGTHRRTQSDIVFNNTRNWNSYRGPTQPAIDMRRVGLHELGHALGLDHPDEAGQTVSAIMNSRVSSVDSLRQDDIEGAQFLYGTPGTIVRPANDNFASAVAVTLTGNAATVTGSSINATKETGEPSHAPNEPGGASIWWKWTATASGSLNVTTAGSNFDTLLAAYTGSSVGALTQLAGNDDVDPGVVRTSTITFNVTAGTTYFFAVDGWEAEWGSITLNFTLTPLLPDVAPTITTQPQSQTVTVGASVVFSVTASGRPTPTYQWSRNGAAIAGATSPTLTLSNVQSGDAGNYTVTVSNSVGSVTSSTATLTVNPTAVAPAITAQPQSQTVTAGGSATFSVTATGTPAPTYQWARNGSAIAGATGASLALTNIQTSDAGSYTVTVSNSAGSVTSSTATLTVNSAPPPPPPAPPPSGGGGGGGGAPSLWFLAALATALLARSRRSG